MSRAHKTRMYQARRVSSHIQMCFCINLVGFYGLLIVLTVWYLFFYFILLQCKNAIALFVNVVNNVFSCQSMIKHDNVLIEGFHSAPRLSFIALISVYVWNERQLCVEIMIIIYETTSLHKSQGNHLQSRIYR